MAKLRIQASDGKTLVIDVTGHDPSEYDELAAAANEDYMARTVNPYGRLPEDVTNEPGVQDATLSTVHNLGTLTKAGYSGLANLAAGNTADQAKTDVENVEAGNAPETTSGKVGEFIGGLVTPEQIALQGGMGKFLEASGIGEWATNILKGWAEKTALNAVGIIKNIAKGIGLNNLDEVAQFLMAPVKIGAKELPPVIQATSSTKDMLVAAQAIQKAAGDALGKISPAVDEVVAAHPEAIDLKALLESLDKMKLAVQEIAPNLGKAVVNQYEAAIDDFLNVVQKSTLENNPSLFSDLRALKTTIGDLVYKHGNPLESKAALEDAYKALSTGIDAAAQAADPAIGAAFNEANAVYTKISAIVDALSNKAISAAAKGFFNDIPALAAGFSAAASSGPMGLITGPAAFLTAKALENYGPQAIAKGLNAVAPAVAPAITTGVRALPVVGNAIASALTGNQ